MFKNKKKNLRKSLVLTSLFAALALIGTGYASWTFSKDATASATGSVGITTVSETGTLTVTENETVYLIIDENWIGWSTVAYDKTADVASTSVDEALEACKAAAVTTIKLKYSGDGQVDSAATGSEVVDFSVDYTNSVSAYITMTKASTEFSKNNVTYTTEDIVTVYTLPTLSWADSKKPGNITAYEAMNTAIGTASVSFTFTADVK